MLWYLCMLMCCQRLEHCDVGFVWLHLWMVRVSCGAWIGNCTNFVSRDHGMLKLSRYLFCFVVLCYVRYIGIYLHL